MPNPGVSEEIAAWIATHPKVGTALDEIAREFDFQVDLALIDKHLSDMSMGLLSIGDLIVKESRWDSAIAIIHPDGSVEDLSQEER